jgi:5-carboxymethyl-2-hydroxymuconate isomerase
MPHLVIQHTPNIDTDVGALARKLNLALLAVRDEEGKQVYPEGGTRVMAFAATDYSVGDGVGDYRYMFLYMRILDGRTDYIVKQTGDLLMAAVKEHLEPIFTKTPMGVTLNIEATPLQLPAPMKLVYEGFHNSLRAVFGR